MQIISLDKPISDKERAELLFQGEVLIYRNIDAMWQLIEYSDKLLRETLGGLDPVSAQQHLKSEAFLELTEKAQELFHSDPRAKAIFFDALAQCGLNLDNTYYDHFPMRIVPFAKSHNGAHRSLVGHHRDTWGSNIQNQINWWAPLYKLEAERSIALYPHYWHHPIANNTADWSFAGYLAARRRALLDRDTAYPSAPSPTEEVDESGVVKVVLEPGDILNFSSAHLHASVPNSTDQIRFSVEMRTINIQDINLNRVAPNLDNAGKEPMYQWFKNIISKQPLNEALI